MMHAVGQVIMMHAVDLYLQARLDRDVHRNVAGLAQWMPWAHFLWQETLEVLLRQDWRTVAILPSRPESHARGKRG